MDAQEGVVLFLLDQMAEQHAKEVLLAYTVLLSSGVGGCSPSSGQHKGGGWDLVCTISAEGFKQTHVAELHCIDWPQLCSLNCLEDIALTSSAPGQQAVTAWCRIKQMCP